jgi:uncharacterized OB-fold protein/acyl dehydratase
MSPHNNQSSSAPEAAALSREELEAKLREFVGTQTGPPRLAPDPVNEAMIRHWCEVMGDANPIYTDAERAAKSVHGGIVAPPTMLQAWSMRGYVMADLSQMGADGVLSLHALLTANGYPSVVATNSEQGYVRYLRPGDRLTTTTVVEAISEQKATALGTGYFIDTRDIYRNQHGEEVGWMLFRVLKFKPAQQPRPAAAAGAAAPAKPRRLRPPRGHDNAWWWEGLERGELLIQRCAECGRLRHPPRPMCGACQSTQWNALKSSGIGAVHSYVVMHHPKIPGYEYPLVCALVDLAEGTRLLSNVVGCEPADVHIGMAVRASIEAVDDELRLPLFRPAAS